MPHRYTGKDLYLEFNGAPISGAWTSFTWARELALVDVTPLGSGQRIQQPGIQYGHWELALFDSIDEGHTLLQLMKPGSSGLMVIGPQGNSPGKPRLSFTALVTQLAEPFEYDEAVMVRVMGVQNGATLEDWGDAVF